VLVVEDDAETRDLLRRMLEKDGCTVILMTSLLNIELHPHDLFAELYHLRWPVEEDYKAMKRWIEIGNFSGKSVLSVYQDFHAKVFSKNLASALSFPTRSAICRTCKFTDRDSAEKYEVYLSRCQQEDGYSAVARFKRTHSNIIEDLLCCHFEYDEFFIKRIQYVLDFESKRPEALLELITESIEIDLDSRIYENIHFYVETCEINESEVPIIRLNIVVDYPNETGLGVFRDTASEAIDILNGIKFYTFDQEAFLSTLTNKCMNFFDSQIELLKNQIQDITNMNDLRKIASRYVDSQYIKFHPLQGLFEKAIRGKEVNNDPVRYIIKKVILNTEPDIIPELELYLLDYSPNPFSILKASEAAS
jgi:hypothetical protein